MQMVRGWRPVDGHCHQDVVEVREDDPEQRGPGDEEEDAEQLRARVGVTAQRSPYLGPWRVEG